MTAITAFPASTTARTGRYVRAGLAATLAASVATTLLAASGSAAGVSLDIAGEPIPLAGFAQLTAMASLVGLALAAVLARKARNAARTFVRTTVALTVVSFVPDLIAPAAVSTKLLLMLAHAVAAAIVIPTIARRLSR
jgi:Family of unknown function (DUF6069)